ncbi:MAG: cupin domain-containing protein, partial [Planctomycetota bacterium]
GVQEANDKTGRRCLYLPLVSGPHDAMRRQLDAAAAAGCAGVLVCALTQGLDAVREIAERRDLLVMTHPTFTGGFFTTPRHGITPAFLLGTLFRLAGADSSVFPHAGGRFGFSKAECAELAEHLARPMGSAGRAYHAALPSPAGGMTLERVPEMAAMYGQASVLLVGGGLLSLRESLLDGTRVFADAIGDAFPNATTTEPAAAAFASSCEAPGSGGVAAAALSAEAGDQTVTHLPFDADRFVWRGREPIAYKPADASEATPFRDVVRHELFGKQGEPAAFDLRYFEIAPGGYSSLEKHQHVHAIVAVRGRGVLKVEGATHELGPMDLAYVPPMAAHQLTPADDGESFGFLCVVDRDRDRPQPV